VATIDNHLVPNICHDALQTSKILLPIPNLSLSNVLCSAQWKPEVGTVKRSWAGKMIPFPVGSSDCSLPHSAQTSSKVYSVTYSIGKDKGGLSQETKRPGLKSDYSTSSSGEVKNKWSYASALPHALISSTGTNLSLDRRI